MNFLKQTAALTAMGLRDIPQRLGNSLVIVVGIAGVVVVLIPVLAMYWGFRATIMSDGSADRAVVLARAATTEEDSSLSREDVAIIMNAAGVRHDRRGASIASAEVVLAAPVYRLRDHSDVSVTLRGVGPQYFALRPELHLTAGRLFRPGNLELMVGDLARSQFGGVRIGDRVRLQDGDWLVVGAFAGAKGSRDSELIADSQTVLAAYKLAAYNSMVVALDSPSSIVALRNALAHDSRLLVTIASEPRYLASESDDMNRILRIVTYSIGSIMALGALFAALNATYSSVIRRATEMATVRVIGFSGIAVALALLAESLLLAFIGAVIGVVGAYCAFNGVTISTLGGAQFDAQLVYSLNITPTLLGIGLALACGLGLAGGLLPAIGAARANIPELLQET